MDPDLALALELADVADAITMARFRAADLRVERKGDGSPVSDADRDVEAALRDRLRRARAGDAVLGEEQGGDGGGERRWLIDPIDGTRNYVRGVPVFATLLALEVAGWVHAGVVSAPALGRRWWAVRGGGAHTTAGRMQVSGVGHLDQAYVSTTDPRAFPAPLRAGFDRLAADAATLRAFGDFWSHCMVAEGVLDVAVEAPVHPWDVAPLAVIVAEAGGRFTDARGAARLDGGSALSTNGRLHDQVLAVLRGDGGGAAGA